MASCPKELRIESTSARNENENGVCRSVEQLFGKREVNTQHDGVCSNFTIKIPLQEGSFLNMLESRHHLDAFVMISKCV